MSEYWKSTPSYWCKFCAIYVKDTGIERKNHEASGKHQNNIQRSLRDLHKNKEREEREKQRAKDEVARLNGLVGGKGQSKTGKANETPAKPTNAAPLVSSLSVAQQRKAHAEQLIALGVEVPDELKREVTGLGGWQTVSERVISAPSDGIKQEGGEGSLVRGVHKRKVEDEEDEEGAPTSRAWGSKVKTYPGSKEEQPDEDLDALLSGVTKKAPIKAEASSAEQNIKEEPQIKEEPVIKDEEATGTSKILEAVPDANAPNASVKEEEAPAPAVVFKKRKIKK